MLAGVVAGFLRRLINIRKFAVGMDGKRMCRDQDRGPKSYQM
ncbi:hypothetical protein PAMC26577_13245 [Caballeronia sordidicola]|uniref:Uncharacterized protein n=1 Tax=Caballeronia sordidicola TaxID=196367 RepID=A0A242MW91_CABSO|nr:hypothetical protein PAMC26577_13245 [Caballeronia sordidicola]